MPRCLVTITSWLIGAALVCKQHTCPEMRNEWKGMVPGDQDSGGGCTGETSLDALRIA